MNIKELRKKNKMTQKEVADKIGVSISVISRYESGDIIPSKERLEEIAKALNVTAEEIEFDIMPEIEHNTRETKQFNRLMCYVSLLRAKGCCELCGCSAPFRFKGEPYLKVHQLSEDPSLISNVDNYAALCPNCYEKVTLLKNPEDLAIIKENVKKNMEEALI